MHGVVGCPNVFSEAGGDRFFAVVDELRENAFFLYEEVVSVSFLHATAKGLGGINAPPNTASTNTQPDSSVYCYTQRYFSHA